MHRYDLHVLLVEHGKRCERCAKNGRPRKEVQGPCPLKGAAASKSSKGSAAPQEDASSGSMHDTKVAKISQPNSVKQEPQAEVKNEPVEAETKAEVKAEDTGAEGTKCSQNGAAKVKAEPKAEDEEADARPQRRSKRHRT